MLRAGSRHHGAVTTPADPAALLRSRGYLQLLVFAAILGVPISAAVYGFLALASYLQKEVYTHLPHGLGFSTAPVWWPLPMLLAGAVLAALAIQYLPGRGGPSPAGGFHMHGAGTLSRQGWGSAGGVRSETKSQNVRRARRQGPTRGSRPCRSGQD